jgi:hypothetical protein
MAVNMKIFVFGCHAVSPGTELPMDFEESSNRIFRVDVTNTINMNAAASYETLEKLRHTKPRHVPKDGNYLARYSSEKVHVRYQAFTVLCYCGYCFGDDGTGQIYSRRYCVLKVSVFTTEKTKDCKL